MGRCDYRPANGTRCHNPAEGSIGMMRLCRRCVASLLGWKHNDDRLRDVVLVALTNDGAAVGQAVWVPNGRRSS